MKFLGHNKNKPTFQSFFFENNSEEKELKDLTNTYDKSQKVFKGKKKHVICVKKFMGICANNQKRKVLKKNN